MNQFNSNKKECMVWVILILLMLPTTSHAQKEVGFVGKWKELSPTSKMDYNVLTFLKDGSYTRETFKKRAQTKNDSLVYIEEGRWVLKGNKFIVRDIKNEALEREIGEDYIKGVMSIHKFKLKNNQLKVSYRKFSKATRIYRSKRAYNLFIVRYLMYEKCE